MANEAETNTVNIPFKLFLVECFDFVDLGYDTYDSFVICCENENIARKTDPSGEYEWWKNPQYQNQKYFDWVKETEIDKLKVIYLGDAVKSLEKGVICNSYNAG